MNEIIAHRFKTFALCLALVCCGGTAWADQPHYIRLDTSLNAQRCYVVSLKEAGLGTATFITYSLSADACIKAACFTKNGNQVQGVPKSGDSSATQQTTLPVRHGQTTGDISLCPTAFDLPDPGCTGTQELRVIAVQYTSVVLTDGVSQPVALDPAGFGTCP